MVISNGDIPSSKGVMVVPIVDVVAVGPVVAVSVADRADNDTKEVDLD